LVTTDELAGTELTATLLAGALELAEPLWQAANPQQARAVADTMSNFIFDFINKPPFIEMPF
jgi:hypothetical protein